MLFNSYIFWISFCFVFFIYWVVPKKFQNIVLLIFSYCFYGLWDWRFLSLIMISTLVDFSVAKKIVDVPSKKRFYLLFSIITNIGILGIFKYLGFFIEQLNALFFILGLSKLLPTIDLIIPVGISFYTFQTLSYTIDVYRNDSKPVSSLLDFALYVSFFPQLVAGPIERSYRLLPQIIKPRLYTQVNLQEGFYYIIYGLFLKVVLADNMAFIVDAIYSQSPSELSGVDILFSTYAFAFQIYGDFSGYSFIAIGLGKLFGINLMMNFKKPYLSQSPSEFWRRWHISLSTWLRDYLYIPLGGNKKGTLMTFRNLFLTMLIGGLWHGVGWTYIVWGIFHGIILILFRLIKFDLNFQFYNYLKKLLYVGKIIFMFHLICLGWVFFRSENLDYAFNAIYQVFYNFNYSDQSFSIIGLIIFFIFPIFIYEYWDEKRDFKIFNERPTASLVLIFNYCFFMIIIFPAPMHKEFIYFQF
mgnify:CR=1 FL=1